jgi:hypothetical protein
MVKGTEDKEKRGETKPEKTCWLTPQISSYIEDFDRYIFICSILDLVKLQTSHPSGLNSFQVLTLVSCCSVGLIKRDLFGSEIMNHNFSILKISGCLEHLELAVLSSVRH